METLEKECQRLGNLTQQMEQRLQIVLRPDSPPREKTGIPEVPLPLLPAYIQTIQARACEVRRVANQLEEMLDGLEL